MSTPAGRPPAPPGPDRWVWVNGELCRGDDATLSLFDRGARDGEGLFETVRVYEGRPLDWERHLERLVVSAAELGFPVPASPAALRRALDQVLEASGLSEAVARVTVTRGIPSGGKGRRTRAGAWVDAEPLGARLWAGTRAGAARVVLSKRPFDPGPLGPHKTTSRLAYHLAREEARAARADEALLVSSDGHVLEGSASNVFAVIGGRVVTPPLSLGILPGVVRARVWALCDTLGLSREERALTPRELAGAEEVFLTSSVQEVVPVGWLEGRAISARAVGEALASAYREEMRGGPGGERRNPQIRR